MKTKVGKMPCPDCQHPVNVRENEHGTLSYSCDECDGNGYSKKTEGRHAAWRARMTPIEGAPAPKKETAPAPAPAPKKTAGTLI